jgi:hypothetical protein
MRHLKLVTVLTFLFIPVAVWAQQPASLTGKYEGAAKAPSGEVKLSLDLVDESGKFSGRLKTGYEDFDLVKGQLVDGLLTLEFADAKNTLAKLAVRQKDDKLVGDLSAHGEMGKIELARVAAKDEISGEWNAVADAQGQPFPFSLTLKIDGEKVTGSSSSQLGTSAISAGTWKEGKLAIILESGSGQIVLNATFADGKLTGDYDFAGQASGKWAAVKKNP